MGADEITWVLDDGVVHVVGDGDERGPARWGLAQPELIEPAMMSAAPFELACSLFEAAL
jgi:hypothetical protein